MTSDPEFDDVSGPEADTADVIDQAETAGGEPVEEALDSRERVSTTDPVEDEQISEDAEEAAGGADAD